MRDPGRVVVSDYDRDRRWIRALLVDLDEPTAEPVVLDDRSVNDRYGDPGALVSEADEHGARLVRQDGHWVYRTGSGESPGGARPFLDRQDLETGAVERLWRCAPGSYESLAALQPGEAGAKPRILTVYESPEEPPNWRLRDLERDTIQTLTDFPDPTPQLRGIHKELVTYERADGVAALGHAVPARRLRARGRACRWSCGPIRWSTTTRRPPARCAARRTASRASGGISHLLLLTQGYAMLDDATMPIIGDPETMNDTFVEQIVAAAQAAIDKAVELGVADRERVAVGGHSYGAFMTANLLAHCDLFRAGIARSGAYNRTLTPVRLPVASAARCWEAPEIYFGDLAVHARRHDRRAAAPDPRRDGQQLGHLPDPVRAAVPGRSRATAARCGW